MDCNPYLGTASTLACGYLGLMNKTEARPEFSGSAYIDNEDIPANLGDALDRHAARGLPDADFAEVYTRFSKSLIGVGSAAGADHDFGLETELVALANPYTDDMSGGLPLRLTYRGEVRADAQVEIFDRAPSGEVTITRPRTNAEGVVTVPVTPGHHYMADAVVLREPEGENLTGAVWESLWANLTWAVPGP